MSFRSEEKMTSPKRIASPFRGGKPTLATMPNSFMQSFCSSEHLENNNIMQSFLSNRSFETMFSDETCVNKETVPKRESSFISTFKSRKSAQQNANSMINGSKRQKFTSFTSRGPKLSRMKFGFKKIRSYLSFKSSLSKDYPDVAPNCSKSSCSQISLETFESFDNIISNVSYFESGLLHEVAAFLDVKDVVNLSMVDHRTRRALFKCPVRLDLLNRSFSLPQLAYYFHDLSKMTSWKITGINLQSEFASSVFWEFLDISRLVHLKLKGRWQTLDFQNLAFAPELKVLECGHFPQEVSSLEALKFCRKITNLIFQGCADVVSTGDFVPRSSSLQELDLQKCSNLSSIASLRYCTKLVNINLSSCKLLNDITPLKFCLELKQVILKDLSLLKSIQVLSDSSNLQKLDVSGCVSVSDLTPPMKCSQLEDISLARCSASALMNLLDSRCIFSSAFSATLNLIQLFVLEVTAALSTYPVALFGENLPSLVSYALAATDLTDPEQVIKLEGVCTVMSELATRDSAQGRLLDAGAVDAIISLFYKIKDLGFCEKATKLSVPLCSLVAKLSHEQESVMQLVENNIVSHLLMVSKWSLYDLENEEEMDKSRFEKLEESCASSFLLLALQPNCRNAIFSGELLDILIKLMNKGTNNSADEAAGAVWNLAACLKIGERIVLHSEADCIKALVSVLHNRHLKAKLQAAGAMRNLSIVPTNIKYLIKSEVIPHLINQANYLIDPLWNVADVSGSNIFVDSLEQQTEEISRLPHNSQRLFEIGKKISTLDSEEVALLCKIIATLRILLCSFDCQQEAHLQCLQAGGIEVFNKIMSLFLLDKMTALSIETIKRTFDGVFRDLFLDCAGALCSLSFTCDTRNRIANGFGLKSLVLVISSPEDSKIVTSCCGCLWNLALDDDLERRAVEEGALPALVLKLEDEDEAVVSKAIGALKNLSYQSKHKEAILALGADTILISKIQDICDSPETSSSFKLLGSFLGTLKVLAAASIDSRFALIQKDVAMLLLQILNIDPSGKEAQFKDVIHHAVDALGFLSEVLMIPVPSMVASERALCNRFIHQMLSLEGEHLLRNLVLKSGMSSDTQNTASQIVTRTHRASPELSREVMKMKRSSSLNFL